MSASGAMQTPRPLRDQGLEATPTVFVPRLQLYHQPPPRSAGLQPAMGLGRLLRGIDLRHARREVAGFDLLAEPAELLELVRVGPHQGRGEADPPLRGAQEAADRG